MVLLFIRLDFVETGPRWIISNILFMYEIFFADASISLLPLPQMTAWTSRPLPLIFPPYQPHLHLSIDQETSRQFSLHQYHLLTRGISNHEFRNFLGSYTKSLVYHVGYRHISSVESCDDSKRQQFRQYHPEIIKWNFDTVSSNGSQCNNSFKQPMSRQGLHFQIYCMVLSKTFQVITTCWHVSLTTTITAENNLDFPNFV